MTAAHWIAVALVIAVVLFAVWHWTMNRLDERRERETRAQFRREPPALGGAQRDHPRHLRRT